MREQVGILRGTIQIFCGNRNVSCLADTEPEALTADLAGDRNRSAARNGDPFHALQNTSDAFQIENI